MKMYEALQTELGMRIANLPQTPVEDGVDNGSWIENRVEDISGAVSDNPTAVVVAGALAGAAIGAGLEYHSLKKIDSNRQKLSEVHGDLIEDINPDKKTRITKSLISLGAIGGLALGTANALSWAEFDETTTQPPNITLIVDKSFKTLLPEQDSAIAIRNLVDQFDQTLDDFSATAQVAGSSSVRPMDLASAADIEPFGGAPISDAFDISVSSVGLQRENLEIGETITNNAIVLLTDGNGVDASVAAQNIENINVPVYVVDVSSDSRNESGLRSITEATGGEYYDRDDVETVDDRVGLVSDIGAKIESTDKETGTKPNWISRISLLALSAVALGKWKYDRPKLTSSVTTKNKLGKSSELTEKNK